MKKHQKSVTTAYAIRFMCYYNTRCVTGLRSGDGREARYLECGRTRTTII
jgi:hypothetical protein